MAGLGPAGRFAVLAAPELPARRLDSGRPRTRTSGSPRLPESAVLEQRGLASLNRAATRRTRKSPSQAQPSHKRLVQEMLARINVSLDTIWNWELGRRYFMGAAKALLRVLDRMPQLCLDALT
ncbi:hypothetical protein V0R37_17410 [Pollutimonas sp. H1-120]|uniref:helix-turn-helix domain-containing protein n=1 Tax=Pollutimonas sp. H1-120 TaxID=3148824 RepID=UPI003B51DEEF